MRRRETAINNGKEAQRWHGGVSFLHNAGIFINLDGKFDASS